jgi:hypothetical protein
MLKDYPGKKHSKLSERGRKGIPNSLRGFAWSLLTQANTSGHTITNQTASICGTASSTNQKGITRM